MFTPRKRSLGFFFWWALLCGLGEAALFAVSRTLLAGGLAVALLALAGLLYWHHRRPSRWLVAFAEGVADVGEFVIASLEAVGRELARIGRSLGSEIRARLRQ